MLENVRFVDSPPVTKTVPFSMTEILWRLLSLMKLPSSDWGLGAKLTKQRKSVTHLKYPTCIKYTKQAREYSARYGNHSLINFSS